MRSVPLRATQVQLLEPVLAFASIYYWSLYRPDLMPAAAVFVLGQAYDALTGAPIGVHAATLTLAHAVLCRQRRFLVERSFILNWVGFAIIAFGACILAWLLNSMFHARPVEPWGVLFQTLMTVVVFPLIFRLLLHLHLAVVQPG